MKKEDTSRRAVLRAALAAGCSLWMPLALPADAAKKDAPPASGKKIPQASVQYQAMPKGEHKCANCNNYIAESNTCKLVEGPISPEGWCNQWVKKA